MSDREWEHVLDTNAGTTGNTLGRLRNEPVQARSAARLDALLDAAAAVLDEVGYERLTTALIAQRASASIGTVYRYFPDRLAVLQGLASRAADRVLARVRAELDTVGSDFLERLDVVFSALVRAHREDTGFRVVCVFESMQVLGPQGGEEGGPEIVQPLLELAVGEGVDVRDDHVTAFLVGETLIHRAFIAGSESDDEIVATASRAARQFAGATV